MLIQSYTSEPVEEMLNRNYELPHFKNIFILGSAKCDVKGAQRRCNSLCSAEGYNAFTRVYCSTLLLCFIMTVFFTSTSANSQREYSY